jgi:hypothetical protein
MDTVGIVGSKLKLTNHRLKSEEIEDLAPLHVEAFSGWLLQSADEGRLTSRWLLHQSGNLETLLTSGDLIFN